MFRELHAMEVLAINERSVRDVSGSDVATRWSSTFKMCRASYVSRVTFDAVLESDLANDSVREYRISAKDWSSIEFFTKLYNKAANFA